MKHKPVIGITHLIKPPFTPELAAWNNDIDIVYFDSPDESAFEASALRRLDAFLVWTPRISQQTVAQLVNCKIVVRYGVGYDKIDRLALARAGIAFSNNPEYGPEDVADTALSMILVLQRRVLEHDIRCRGYVDSWQEHHLSPLLPARHSTVGVVGVGRIGISVINRLKPFGFHLLGYDPYISNGLARAVGVERVSRLEELFARSNVVTLHCPLTEETQGMVSSELVNQSKPGLIVVNTARGALIETLDVLESGLKSRQIGAVGLDVLPDEPPQAHPLIEAWRASADWLVGRLVITPHNAFYSDHAFYECRYQAAETARLFLRQNRHRNAI